MSGMSTVLGNTDGCDMLYMCVLDIYLLIALASSIIIIMDFAINEPVPGRNVAF